MRSDDETINFERNEAMQEIGDMIGFEMYKRRIEELGAKVGMEMMNAFPPERFLDAQDGLVRHINETKMPIGIQTVNCANLIAQNCVCRDGVDNPDGIKDWSDFLDFVAINTEAAIFVLKQQVAGMLTHDPNCPQEYKDRMAKKGDLFLRELEPNGEEK